LPALCLLVVLGAFCPLYALVTGSLVIQKRSELKPVKKCSDQVEPATVDLCKSPFRDAPETFNAEVITYNIRRIAYERLCPRRNCAFEINDRKILTAINYNLITQKLVQKLQQRGHQIAYENYSSGNILVTTKPKSTQNPRTYYYVNLNARRCLDTYDPNNPCGLFVQAVLITRTDTDQDFQSRDELCSQLEDIVRTYLYRTIDRVGR
jgi:hypothetical protein